MVRIKDKTWKKKDWKGVVSVDIKYKDRERSYPVVCIWKRTPIGKIKYEDPDIFPSYFYIPLANKDEINNIPPHLKPESIEYPDVTSLKGEKVIKINYERFSKKQFKEARELFSKTFEDDVKYLWRYLLDNDVEYSQERRICYFDIETNMSVDVKKTPEAILSIAVYDSLTKTKGVLILDETIKIDKKLEFDKEKKSFIMRYNSEVGLLNGFVEYIKKHDPDIMTAYNLIGFDFPYLINRMRRLNINYRQLSDINECWAIVNEEDNQNNHIMCGGRELLDMFVLLKKLYDEDKPEDWKLDSVGEKIIGMKKVEHEYRNLSELYEKDMDKFIEYNLRDVEIMVAIEEKVGIITQYLMSLQKLIPMPLSQIINNSVALDFYILKTYNDKKIFPSKRKREREHFSGAITGRFEEDEKGNITSHAPRKKLYHNVGVLDFSGMYPNIFRTFNISPETLTMPGESDSVTIGENAFSQVRIGLLPALVENIINLRDVYKKKLETMSPNDDEYSVIYNLQYGVKRLNNSLYGALGYSGFRLFDVQIAKSITFMGQELIKKVYTFLLHSMGYETLYSDTDSVFIQLKCKMTDKKATEAELAMIEEKINTMIDEYAMGLGANKNYMKMDFEKRFTTLIFLGVKKRYIGMADLWKGIWLKKQKFLVKGFDLVRRTMSPMVKDIVRTIILMILENKTFESIKTFYVSSLKKVRGADLSDIAWTVSLGKNISEYTKTLPQHIKGALVAKQYFDIDFQKGDSPKMMYVKGLEYVRLNGDAAVSDVISFRRNTLIPITIRNKIDRERFIKSYIIDKLKPFIDVEGIEIGKLFRKNVSLKDFMGEFRND